jgi:hypothetical protein
MSWKPKVDVTLARIGKSRSSLAAIRIEARIRAGSKWGDDLLAGRDISDVNAAKVAVGEALQRKLGVAADVTFEDRTAV